MTIAQKKRMRRRRRFRRNVKRVILNILLAPMRMPRIAGSTLENAIKFSEITGIVFAAMLIAHLFNPEFIGLLIVIVTAAAFVVCLMTIKLGDYQDQLEELRYYGFNI